MGACQLIRQDVIPIQQVSSLAFGAGLVLGIGLVTTVIGISLKSPKKILIGVVVSLLGVALGMAASRG